MGVKLRKFLLNSHHTGSFIYIANIALFQKWEIIISLIKKRRHIN